MEEIKKITATELLDIDFRKYKKITIDHTSIYLSSNIEVRASKYALNVQNKFILENILVEGTLEGNLLFARVYQLGDVLSIEENDLDTSISSILITKIHTSSSIIKDIKEVDAL